MYQKRKCKYHHQLFEYLKIVYSYYEEMIIWTNVSLLSVRMNGFWVEQLTERNKLKRSWQRIEDVPNNHEDEENQRVEMDKEEEM